MEKTEYVDVGGYLIPNLTLKQRKKGKLGKYGLLRLDYLQNHKKGLYNALKMKDELLKDLEETQFDTTWHINHLIIELAEKEGVTEKLKATNQMEWVRKMNNIKNRAEEIMIKEFVYDGSDY